MKIFFIVLILVIGDFTYAQWKDYLNTPTTDTRHNDIHFHSKEHGTLVGPFGLIQTTFDGGQTWEVSDIPANYFRSVGFLNSSVGFAGSLSSKMYRTRDGGSTWENISNNFDIGYRTICGISCVDGWVYATGNYAEPAEFYRSDDEGDSWEYLSLDTILLAAVEVKFLNIKEGYISGMGLDGRGTIIYTTDGGDNWKIVGIAEYPMSYVWKLDFLESGRAYGAVQNLVDAGASFVRRESANAEWTTHTDYTYGMDPQGIGFVNDDTGWISGSFYTLERLMMVV